ncbi:hypothetical protein VNO77_41036 [Canavalia gladiata]|uniref:Uncharacterized protein n=1 Tax=Canavalia gladiata TaxID=3824 RepID=A0AAN9K0G3_CANGL
MFIEGSANVESECYMLYVSVQQQQQTKERRSKRDPSPAQGCYDVVFCFPLSLMGFFRKMAGFLGFAKDDVHDHDSKDDANDELNGQPRTTPFRIEETGLPRKGFGVRAQVVVDRPHLGPILTPSTSGDGAVQGLGWYAKRLRIDEDGDVADEFLDEVSSEMPATLAVDHHRTPARFKLKHGTRSLKVKKQILSDGKIQQFVEHQGRLQWV